MISGMVRTRVKVGKDTCEPRNQPPIDRQPWRMAVKLIKSFSPIYQRDTAPSRACSLRSWKRDRGRAIYTMPPAAQYEIQRETGGEIVGEGEERERYRE